MNTKKKYYSLEKTGKIAQLNIYGDICSWPWEFLGEVSAVSLTEKLDQLEDVDEIQVFINSYGGEVAEGLAIYNSLKRHPAKVTTFVDGFACSIASVIFMAGDERIMNDSSLLMIHNAWQRTAGNADELRKAADDLDKINQASIEAYKSHSTIDEEEIKALMDAETWILPSEAIEYGFATATESSETNKASASAKSTIIDLLRPDKKTMQSLQKTKTVEAQTSNKLELNKEPANPEKEKTNVFDSLLNVLK